MALQTDGAHSEHDPERLDDAAEPRAPGELDDEQRCEMHGVVGRKTTERRIREGMGPGERKVDIADSGSTPTFDNIPKLQQRIHFPEYKPENDIANKHAKKQQRGSDGKLSPGEYPSSAGSRTITRDKKDPTENITGKMNAYAEKIRHVVAGMIVGTMMTREKECPPRGRCMQPCGNGGPSYYWPTPPLGNMQKAMCEEIWTSGRAIRRPRRRQ